MENASYEEDAFNIMNVKCNIFDAFKIHYVK